MVGEHEGGYSPFDLDVTGALIEGENTLVVRVDDPPDLQEIPPGKQSSVPPNDPWDDCDFTSSSGIWQTVWLEPRPATYLAGVRITPDVDGRRALFAVAVQGGAEGDGDQEFVVRPPSGNLIIAGTTTRMPAGQSAATHLAIDIPDPQLWDVDDPNLYAVDLRVRGPEGQEDVVHTYFGMRKVEVSDGQVRLNGRPIYMMTALDQGYWPEGVYTAPTDAALQNDVLIARRLGLNGLRKHIKIEDPRFAYWADQIGLLLWCDAPSPVLFTRVAGERLEHDIRDMIERDYNHPSVVVWCPYNESWGLRLRLGKDQEKQSWGCPAL